jgi:hypothetical protein
MVTICWAAKGGSGTTVVTAALALSSASPSLLVDLDGELPAVLGVGPSDRPGVADWLESDATAEQLAELFVDVGRRHRLLPWRSGPPDHAVDRPQVSGERWEQLGVWLDRWGGQWGCPVVVDAGTRLPPAPLVEHSTRSLLVTRPCYLALRRAVAAPVRPTGIVLVDEPGRGLRAADVEHALGVPVEATVRVDPAIARAVDAGLLAGRVPRVIARDLRRVAA